MLWRLPMGSGAPGLQRCEFSQLRTSLLQLRLRAFMLGLLIPAFVMGTPPSKSVMEGQTTPFWNANWIYDHPLLNIGLNGLLIVRRRTIWNYSS